MRSRWIVQASQRPTTSICRACLSRLAAGGGVSSESTAPHSRVARGASSGPRALHISSSLAANEATAAAPRQPSAGAEDGPEAGLSRPKPRFGGLAGTRRPTGPSVEELERAQFVGNRAAAAPEGGKRTQKPQGGGAASQFRLHRSTSLTQSPKDNQGPPDASQTEPRHQGSKIASGARKLDLSQGVTPKQDAAGENSHRRPNLQSGSRNLDLSQRSPDLRRENTSAQSRRGQDSASTALPQQTRVLRQEPAQSQPQREGWGSLRQRTRPEQRTRADDSQEARPSSQFQEKKNIRQRGAAQDPYQDNFTQREEAARGGDYVSFAARDDPEDGVHGRKFKQSASITSKAESTPRRGSGRFVDEDEADDPGESRTGGRQSATYNAAPQRRGKSQNRRAQKFEDEDADELLSDMGRGRGRDKAQKKRAKTAVATTPIELPPFMSVQSLAIALRQRPEDLVTKLEELGFEDVAMDHVLDAENAGLVAMEYNFEPIIDRSEEEDLFAAPMPEDVSSLPPRPPVITIMGHVDHGKTTILDYLRKSAIAASEHGGITQHIGAFVVPMASGKEITFLDTPGHAAFLSMRERGANVTDIVILVVAADDSVKPQTIEAIKHAKAAKVPIIVAINKVDKDQADVNQVKQDLMVHDIEVEDFGGDYQAIEVSGKTGQGMDDLEEAMITQAELLDMRASKDGLAEGWIIEATTKRSGRTATVLVRRGTLRIGDVIVAGMTWARVRTLRNEAGLDVTEAGPGTPVEVDGWRDQPAAGDEVLQAETEQRATSVIKFRQERVQRSQAAVDMQAINEARRVETEKRAATKAAEEAAKDGNKENGVTEDQPSRATQAGPKHTDLYLIVKADVSGSTEAVTAAIESIPIGNQPVSIHILRTGVGPASEFDLDQLKTVPTGEGFLVSFNQAVPPHIAQEAERAAIRILDNNIIYKVIDGVRELVEDHLPPVITPRVLGDAEVAQSFDIRIGRGATQRVAGCKVRNGVIQRNKRVRVYRGDMTPESIVFDGQLSSLRSHKRDVPDMKKGSECGLSFDGWEAFQAGDVVQCYEERSERRRLT